MKLKAFVYCVVFNLGIISVLGRSEPQQHELGDELDTYYNKYTTVLAYETGRVDLDIACPPSITEVSCKSVCNGDLIFEDNFDTMNWTKWQREVRIGIVSDDREFVSYQSRPENCYVNDGELHIMTSLLSEVPGFDERSIENGTLDLRSHCTAFLDAECYRFAAGRYHRYLPPIVSARIRTKGSFEFRYGRIEVRAKLPKGDWLYPQILLEPVEHWYGYEKYASGQMRVAFARGNEDLFCDNKVMGGSYLQGGTVVSYLSKIRELWLKQYERRAHLGEEFHVYALTWTDSFIAVEVDGTEYGRIYGRFEINSYSGIRWKNGEYMAPFDRKFYIVLGVGVGGSSDFPDNCKSLTTDSAKPWTNFGVSAANDFWNAKDQWLGTWDEVDAGLHVDYVRVFAI